MPNVEPVYFFYYAQALKGNEKYESAFEWMNTFEKSTTDSRGKLEKSYEQNFNRLLVLSNNIQFSSINKNSKEADFSPAYYGDKLVFVSSRKHNQGSEVYAWDKNPYLDLYSAKREKYGYISDINPLSSNINSKLHEGPVTFDSTLQTMYFTRNYPKGLKKGRAVEKNLKICISENVDNQWSEPVEFEYNNPEYSVGHPSLSPDGQWLYFASDMPGGMGGTDIYVCHRENGKWGEPQNLGMEINTEGNEMFPFIHKSNVLYFASDGRGSFGGLDLFMAQIKTWDLKPEFELSQNLGVPFNSSKDDFGMIVASDEKSGYISSNRDDGEGSDDIYYFESTEIMTDLLTSNDDEIVVDSLPVAINQDSLTATSTSFFDNKIEVGKSYVLENIYYDLDKSDIRSDARPELDNIVKVLTEYPNMKIELSSHTDSRASFGYNQRLSQRRAASAVMYIISRGINADRLTARGYGETQPVNACIDGIPCSEAQHQKNRRTEIKVIEK